MENFEHTATWSNTLGRVNSDNQADINKLKEVFLSFRSKVSILAAEVSRSLPGYTVHDISHIDALWEMADCICGDNYELNPLEGFVLGGVFLLHDLAMSISAYPNGIKELEVTDLWKDTVLQKYISEGYEIPESTNYDHLNADVKEYVISTVLRKFHAKTAEKLVTTAWKQCSTGEPQFLIDSTEIRLSLGQVIGRIAHSHWWKINKVECELPLTLGAPSWCPKEWTIDQLKIACILRVSDAAHIDARRAPSFLRSLRKLNPESDEHWCFQEKLQKPYLSDDFLFYTSGYSFPSHEAPAWWLCYEVLKIIDKELRQTDALLAAKQMIRFKAKHVFGVESPERLASLIQTEGWSPIDAFIHIGDLPKIIRTLGGKELYGREGSIPIRELIQNSSDAVRARRILEKRPETWGNVIVRASNKESKAWIEVEDNGIGMSLDVVKQYLFEFGSCYWNSELMHEEHPGLTANGMIHTGKYGIGFFSVFMLGESINITTREHSVAQNETYVIEFRNGLDSRPIVRKANPEEYLVDGGTKIRINLKGNEDYEKLFLVNGTKKLTLNDICVSVAPALDCNLVVEDAVSITIPANHWLKCTNRDFLDLLVSINKKSDVRMFCDEEARIFLDLAAKNVELIKNEFGEILGRAFLDPSDFLSGKKRPYLNGVVVVGGLRESYTQNICGILYGETTNIARDKAIVLADKNNLVSWATNQAKLIPSVFDGNEQIGAAQLVRILGGHPGDLSIARNSSRFYSYNQMKEIAKNLNEIFIFHEFFLTSQAEEIKDFKLNDNIYYCGLSGSPSIFPDQRKGEWGNEFVVNQNYELTNVGYICDILAEVWNIPIENLIKIVDGKKKEELELEIGTHNRVAIHKYGYVFSK